MEREKKMRKKTALKRLAAYLSALVTILALFGCVSGERGTIDEGWLPALYEVQEGFHFALGEDGRTEKVKSGDWDNYVLCLNEQGNIPEQVKIRFPAEESHLIGAVDGEGNVLGRWETGEGTWKTEIPDGTVQLHVSVSAAEQEDIDIQVKGRQKECENTPLKGKNLSVIADSVSAYGGYIPKECIPYYSKYDGRNVDVTDMWWYRTARQFGMNLCEVNASGSSGVTHLEIDGFSDEYYEKRPELLRKENQEPDVIFSWLGGNDSLRGVSREEFFDAYCRLVNRLKELYPKAEIYLLTYYAPPGIGEEWSQMMNEEIRRTADAYGVKVLDSGSCGINEDTPQYMVDLDEETGKALHPNREGQRMIADQIGRELIRQMEDET